MPRKRIRDIRRAELAQAAFDELVASGMRGTTLERVATRVGVSKSVVLHHFKDKNALFEVVMRRANAKLSDGVIELLRHAETPIERLYAVFVGNFAETVFNQPVCQAWITLCAEAAQNPQNQRIQAVLHARLHSNLKHPLRQIAPREDAERIAFQLVSTIDGVWLRAGLQRGPMSMRDALDHVGFALLRLVDGGAPLEERCRKASAKMEHLAGIILTTKAFAGVRAAG